MREAATHRLKSRLLGFFATCATLRAGELSACPMSNVPALRLMALRQCRAAARSPSLRKRLPGSGHGRHRLHDRLCEQL